MFSVKLHSFRATWLLLCLLFVTCTEDEPEVFGNDGALLTNIQLDNSVALVSTVTRTSTSLGDHSYYHEQLFTVNQEGRLDEAQFTITGTGGGFDKYMLNDLNDTYFLISFYLRKESYIVDKRNGNAVKSAYVNAQNLSLYNDYHSKFNYAFYGVHANTDFYFKDFDHNWFHVSHFLSGNAVAEPITFAGSSPEQVYFDSKGGLYYNSQYSLYYYSNGISTLVVTDHVGIFNGRDGSLKVVQENGKVSHVLDGVMSDAFTVPGQVYPGNPFKVFHFKALNKSLGIYTSKISGKTIVYDLDAKAVKMELTREGGNNVYIRNADAYNNFIMIVHEVDGDQVLRILDVANYEFSEVEITGLTFNQIERFYAVSENLMLAEVCRTADGGQSCYKDTKMLKSTTGVAQSVATVESYGKVIKLN